MGYSNEDFEKQRAYVEKQMEGLDNDHISAVVGQLRHKWPNASELDGMIADQKKKADVEVATPEEIDELFKNMRI